MVSTTIYIKMKKYIWWDPNVVERTPEKYKAKKDKISSKTEKGGKKNKRNRQKSWMQQYCPLSQHIENGNFIETAMGKTPREKPWL